MQKTRIFRVVVILTLIHLWVPDLSAQERLWAGTNQYQLWFQYPTRIWEQLDWMVDSNLKVLRIFLGAREYQSWEDPPYEYTFEDPIGNYHDDRLLLVDYLMNECAARGIRMIVALENRTDPYLSTFGPVGMYENEASINAYKNRFTYFLNHYNAFLGAAWKDLNDVVYAWEIQNEPGIPLLEVDWLNAQEKHDLIRNFLNEMATHLKTVDPDTKVSLGIAGYAYYYHNGNSGDDIGTLGDIPDADIYNLHFYGGNFQAWINDNLDYCRSINKLLFLEEFGATRENGQQNLINTYSYAIELSRTNGIPWMFWRMGHYLHDTTWSINYDDQVWQEVVIPEAQAISGLISWDNWGVSPRLGDVNGDDTLDILDIVLIVAFLLDQADPNDVQFTQTDINLDAALDVLDVVQIIDFILNPGGT